MRKFKVPILNFDAPEYPMLIDWTDVKITQPPLIMKMSEKEIQFYIIGDKQNEKLKFKFPCHTQAVERCVKFVTEASKSDYLFSGDGRGR